MLSCVRRRSSSPVLRSSRRFEATTGRTYSVALCASLSSPNLSVPFPARRNVTDAKQRYVADVLECLRGCLLDSTTITAFLNEVRVSFAGPVSKGAKRGRTSLRLVGHRSRSKLIVCSNAGSRSDRLSELVVVLESVEFKTIAVTHGLILALFELLSSLLEIAASAQVDIQYAGQLMLATLSKVVENVKVRNPPALFQADLSQPDSGITSDSIRMSPVLDLMRGGFR